MRQDGLAIGLAILAGLVLFLPFIGITHLFDWDEINFAESAREMLLTGDYLNVQINFEHFREKPPLFIWMQVLSMKLFGINEFAARFPNTICSIFTLTALYRVGQRVHGHRFGLMWMLVYLGSVLPFFYFKSGLIDPWFNLFTFLGIAYFAYYFIYKQSRRLNLVLAAVFIGLGILTKGPVALLILLLVFLVYLFYQRFRIKSSFADVLLFTFVLVLVGGFWFLLQILNGNLEIIQDFITYQIRLFQTEDAGHGGFMLYHFVVMLLGVFPASVFAIRYLFKRTGRSKSEDIFLRWMKILFWTVLILFTVVSTKIVHYSSMAYLPLTFIATLHISKLVRGNKFIRVIGKTLIFVIAVLYTLVVSAISQIEYLKSRIDLSEYIQDPFALDNLEARAGWHGWEWSIGIVFLLTLSYFLFIEKRNRIKVYGLFASTALFTFLTVVFITPRIEEYSQHSAIEFYKSLESQDVYVATLGYKSYAQYFYSKIEPHGNIKASDKEWLLSGEIDKPAYFVMKIHRKDQYLQRYPQLELLYEKNGFVFTKRKD
jgi:4-amino-4-deoxy-L-arabinose transferase-like glycosyltransferase